MIPNEKYTIDNFEMLSSSGPGPGPMINSELKTSWKA